MKIDPSELTLKFKFHDKENMPATVTISIAQFEVRGFRVMRTKFDDNASRFVLYPPAIRGGAGRFMDIVRVADKEEWKRFEEFVLSKFDEEHTKHLLSTFEGEDKLKEVKF